MALSVTSKTTAWLYAVFAYVWVLLIATVLPPIQAPDEGEHLVRADQICRGQPLAIRISDKATGGTIDLGTIEAIKRFFPLIDAPPGSVNRSMYAPISWGAASLWSFPNTALYPPFLYMPAAMSLCFGKTLGWDVLASAHIARVGMALASVSISSVAICMAGSASLWLFALLLLPSSAGLMACITQDGPMIALAALAVGLIVSLEKTLAKNWRPRFVLLCMDLALLGTARPPYAALALLPLLTSVPPPRARWIGCFLTLLCVGLWWSYCASHILVSVDRTAGVDAGAQLYAIFTHPWRIPGLLAATIRVNFLPDYAGYFITTFSRPGVYTIVTWAMLITSAFLVSFAGESAKTWRTTLVLSVVGAAMAGIFAIQYLTWTRLGSHIIEGVMARYFIPIAAVSILVVRPSPGAIKTKFPFYLALPVLVFPAFSIVFTMNDIVTRYYLR